MFQGFLLQKGELHPAVITESHVGSGRGNLNPYSFLGFISFVRIECGQADRGHVFNYTFETPPSTDDNRTGSARPAFVWVRARARGTAVRSARLHTGVFARHHANASMIGVPVELELTAGLEWTWSRVRFDTDGMSAVGVSLGCPVGEASALEVDRLVLTSDASHDPGGVHV